MSAWSLGSAVALVLVFATAVGSKVRSRIAFQEFTAGLGQFGFRSERAMRSAAIGVVGAELTAVGALVIPGGVSTLVRFGPATGLLLVFTVAVAAGSSRNADLVCHCFGSAIQSRVGPHLVVNMVLATLGVMGMAFSGDGRAISAGSLVLAAGLGVLAGVLAVSVSAITEALAPEKGRREARVEEG